MNHHKNRNNIPSLVLDSVVDALSPYVPELTSDELVIALSDLGKVEKFSIPKKPHLYEDEAKEYLKCSYWKLYRLRKKRLLRSFKDGKKNCYYVSDLNRYLERCRRQSR